MKKAMLPLIFILSAFSSFAGAVSVWEGLIDRPLYFVNVEGYSLTGIPPWNPFNDSSITWINIGYEYNKTHTLNRYYEEGTWKEGFFWKHGNPEPFNLSDWNLSKVLREYQWGIKNYLPNVTGKHWPKGYWNSSITRWEVTLSANKFKVVLYGGHCGECEQYITFQCWRNGTNVTCQWGKPILKTHPGPPINGTIPGMESETTSTTSRTTTTPTTTKTTTSPTKNEEKLCGPALLAGLTLVLVLVKRRR